jgi:hypothetical protein
VRGVEEDVATLDFATWRKKYLGQDTYAHQQAWVDIIEGREYTPRKGESYEARAVDLAVSERMCRHAMRTEHF